MKLHQILEAKYAGPDLPEWADVKVVDQEDRQEYLEFLLTNLRTLQAIHDFMEEAIDDCGPGDLDEFNDCLYQVADSSTVQNLKRTIQGNKTIGNVITHDEFFQLTVDHIGYYIFNNLYADQGWDE